MAITSPSGFFKPEGTDTFKSFVDNTCSNIDKIEEELGKRAEAEHEHDSYADKTEQVINTGSASVSMALKDNTEYIFGTLNSLTVELPTGSYEVYMRFTAGDAFSAAGLDNVKWRGDDAPEFMAECVYEISIRDGFGVYAEY